MKPPSPVAPWPQGGPQQIVVYKWSSQTLVNGRKYMSSAGVKKPYLAGGFQPIWKNISQIGNFPQIGVKIKNIRNHHLALFIWVITDWGPPGTKGEHISTPMVENHGISRGWADYIAQAPAPWLLSTSSLQIAISGWAKKKKRRSTKTSGPKVAINQCRCCNPKKYLAISKKPSKAEQNWKEISCLLIFCWSPFDVFFCPPEDTSFVWLFLLLARTFRRVFFGWSLGAAQNCHKTVSLKLIAGRHERTQSVHLQAAV